MFWPTKRARKQRKNKKAEKHARRRMLVESLESRHLLAGVVDVFLFPDAAAPAPPLVPGELRLVGNGDGNHVVVTENAGSNAYHLASGDGNTLFRLSGVGATFVDLDVNGINGPVNVKLGSGNDTFELQGAGTNLIQVLGDVTITNAEGNNTNILTLAELLGSDGLTVTRPMGGIVSNSNLQIIDSDINEDLVVDNDFDGGGGPSVIEIESSDPADPMNVIRGDVTIRNDKGATSTTITDSSIHGKLDIDNDTGMGSVEDIVAIQGTSIGADYFVPPPAMAPMTGLDDGSVVVSINNGDGGSLTTFTRGRESGAPTGPGRVTIFGGIELDNGETIVGKFDIVTFNQTDVLGGVDVENFGGETRTTIIDSKLGMDFAARAGLLPAPVPAPPGFGLGFGGPVIFENGDGRDMFDMQNSEAQWGVSLEHGSGGELWGSQTDINGNSMIGHHPFGPNLGPGIGLPGVGLNIDGDDAIDVIEIEASSVGGDFDLTDLLEGNDSVVLTNFKLLTGVLSMVGDDGNDSLELLASGLNRTVLGGLSFSGADGDDTVRVVDSDILVFISISLGDDSTLR